jgi:hypothetical protein
MQAGMSRYAQTNTADSPFYCFEYDFTRGSGRGVLLTHYAVPDYFRPDVYNTDLRIRNFYSNYRHLIAGGLRTGTNLHFDPKGTSAWCGGATQLFSSFLPFFLLSCF